MDEHYLDHAYKGARRMHVWLTRDLGYAVSRNRIERLYYRIMGLQSLLPGPHTSKRCRDHAVYPYLLRELTIKRSDQVWATDITYVPMKRGFLYLTAIIDLYSPVRSALEGLQFHGSQLVSGSGARSPLSYKGCDPRSSTPDQGCTVYVGAIQQFHRRTGHSSQHGWTGAGYR